MPSIEKHVEISKQRTNQSYREIHEWIDDPQQKKVINAADTNNLDADPLATGFVAIAVGYSLRFPDDLENIKRQFEVYDALYAWCRLHVACGEK